MMMENVLTILRILNEDSKKKYIFFNDELNHIEKIATFHGWNSNTDETLTHLSTAFNKINPILTFLRRRVDIIKKIHDDLEGPLKEIEKRQEYGKHQVTNKFLAEFFKKFTIIKYEIELITDNFNFLQRKIINILNSFPFYYPTPKVSSHKEASKIHFFLEWISLEFLKLLNRDVLKSSYQFDLTINSSFYWNFEKEIRFIPDIKYEEEGKKVLNFVISSDSYLPYRRSHYILLFHECLHFYFKFLDKEYKKRSFLESNKYLNKEFPKEFLSLRKYILGAKAVLEDIGLKISFDDILDVFIDSILTYTFGKNYYLPLFSNIFLYDENLFFEPSLDRNWFIRTKTPLEFLKKSDPKIYQGIYSTLNIYKDTQLEVTRKIETSYAIDEGIIKILNGYISSYIERNKHFLNNLGYSLDSEKYPWISLLLEYQNEYLKDILDNFYQKEKKENRKKFYEGRTLAVKIHNKLLGAKIQYSLEKVPEEELKVFTFKYIKIRAQKNFGDCLSKYTNNELTGHLLNYGSYSFLKIEEHNPKTEELEKCSGENDRVLYFTNNYELTLYDGDLENFKRDLNELDKKIVINIKLVLKREKNQDIGKYEHFKKLVKEGIEKTIKKINNINIAPYYFISFDWFDLFLSLFIDLQEQNSLDLSKLLSELKEHLIVNNEHIHRSETEIFLGGQIAERLSIYKPKFQIRLSSGYSRSFSGENILEKINNIFGKKDNIEINYLYGIRDIEITFKNNEKIKDLLENLIALLKDSNNDISDIQFVPSTPQAIEYGIQFNET